MSCLSLNKFDVEKIVSHAENTSRNNSVEVKAEANKRKSVAIKEDETLVSQVERTKEPAKDLVEELAKVKVIPQKSDRRDYIVLKNESTGTLHQAANKFTQTAWCDVLVRTSLLIICKVIPKVDHTRWSLSLHFLVKRRHIILSQLTTLFSQQSLNHVHLSARQHRLSLCCDGRRCV